MILFKAIMTTESEKIKTEVSEGSLKLVRTKSGRLNRVIESAPGDELDLLSLAPRVRVFDSPSSLVFSADFPAKTFYGDGFIDLLNAAMKRSSPAQIARSRLNLGGTLNDWRMPDNIHGSTTDSELNERHTDGLSEAFIEFGENDRRSYLYAASPITAKESADFIKELAAELLSPQMADVREQALRQMLINSVLDIASVRTPGEKLNLIDTSFLYGHLPDGLKEVVIQASKKANFKNYIVIDPQAPAGDLKSGWADHDNHPYRISHLGKGLVDIKYAQSSGKFTFNGKFPRTLKLKLVDVADYYLSPWQVWARSKTSAERVWIDRSLPQILTDGVDLRANLRLGLVLATALSYERDILPDSLPLWPGGRPQPIKEAQIPTLVKLRESDIKRMVGNDRKYQILDPHLIILNGSYFKAMERSLGFS